MGDDIVFYTDESRTEVLTTWYGLRQQTEKQAVDGVTAPQPLPVRLCGPQGISGINDYAGLFAVTAGHGRREERQGV